MLESDLVPFLLESRDIKDHETNVKNSLKNIISFYRQTVDARKYIEDKDEVNKTKNFEVSKALKEYTDHRFENDELILEEEDHEYRENDQNGKYEYYDDQTGHGTNIHAILPYIQDRMFNNIS